MPGKRKAKGATVVLEKVRDSQVKSFSLRLSHYVVFGEGTVVMTFYLDPNPTRPDASGPSYRGQALVVSVYLGVHCWGHQLPSRSPVRELY